MARADRHIASRRAFSAGVVIVRPAGSPWRCLVLRAFRHWDFPEGEIEPGEDALEAAALAEARASR